MNLDKSNEEKEVETTDAAITAAEADYAQTGKLHDAETALAALRKKYFE